MKERERERERSVEVKKEGRSRRVNEIDTTGLR